MCSAIRYLVVASAILVSAAPTFAHKLLIDCRVKDDRIRVEAFYDDDTPAQQAKVFVENESKQVVAEGRTDERGLWNCPLPAPGKYAVRAEGVGHAAKEILVVPEPVKKEKVEAKKDKKDAGSAKTDVVRDNPSGSFTAPSDSKDEPPQRSRPSREEKTETPWLKLAIGFAVIAVLCVGALLLRRGRHSPLSLD